MRPIAYLFLAASSLAVSAQTEVPDSVSTKDLQEFVIDAPKVIHKADMDVYHPSVSAIEHSKNGMELLRNLQIPSINVNDLVGSVSSLGESVQIRINGRQATIDQLRTLLPETVKRVEWIQNPSLRYAGATTVLNFIVSNPTTGGSFSSHLRPALNTGWGFSYLNAKFNSGKSQWEVGANLKWTNRIKAHREFYETFNFPDGTSLKRDENPIGGYLNNTYGRIGASYNYIKPDTTVFVVDLGLRETFSDKTCYTSEVWDSNSLLNYHLTDLNGNNGLTPSLSLYLQQNLTKEQTIAVSFNSSFYFGRTFSDYVMTIPDSQLPPMTDIYTNINDRNQAYGIEANYILTRGMNRFSAGISYNANRNRSEYENLGGSIFHQRQDKVYFYAEYFRRMGKWSATVGMGAQYTDFLFKETDEGNHSWNPRPQATLTFTPNQKNNFSLNFTSWQSTPTLAETNIVPQQIDDYQWRIGNQDIKTSSSYMLTFRYGLNLPRINSLFGIRAYSSPNAITPLFYWHDNRMINTYENSKGLQNLGFFFAPYIFVIPDWLNISGYLQYRMERMRGTGYDLRSNAFSGYAQIELYHWGFWLTAQYVRAQRDLWGQKISWGEDMNMIDLAYNWKRWSFSVGVMMPFGKYDMGSKSLSPILESEQHTRVNTRKVYISISWNLQWGRQKRGVNKLVNANADADRSTAGGK